MSCPDGRCFIPTFTIWIGGTYIGAFYLTHLTDESIAGTGHIQPNAVEQFVSGRMGIRSSPYDLKEGDWNIVRKEQNTDGSYHIRLERQ